tara:strand:+ start:44 stop:931 length:888 start_codon:yes stop_codon:yes gene_type:complete
MDNLMKIILVVLVAFMLLNYSCSKKEDFAKRKGKKVKKNRKKKNRKKNRKKKKSKKKKSKKKKLGQICGITDKKCLTKSNCYENKEPNHSECASGYCFCTNNEICKCRNKKNTKKKSKKKNSVKDKEENLEICEAVFDRYDNPICSTPKCNELNNTSKEECESWYLPQEDLTKLNCCNWVNKTCLKKLIKKNPQYNMKNEWKECDPNCNGKSYWKKSDGLDLTECGNIKSLYCHCSLNENEPCNTGRDCNSKHCFNPRAEGNPEWNKMDAETDCKNNGGCTCKWRKRSKGSKKRR